MALPSESSPVRIALVDDDSGFLAVLERRLQALRWEREVFSYAPGHEQLTALRVNVLLVNPALSGLDYVERLGATMPGLAVLVISDPAPVADRVRALRGGADDWITKPSHPEELIARIQAVLRRRKIGELPTDDEPVPAGELTIRPDRFDAYVGDEAAGLSRKEYDLLRQLASAGGRVLEREVIYQRVWGYTMVRGDRSVDVFVRKLRNKLERISPDWRYVHTHFGVGYRFAPERSDGDGAGTAPAGGEGALPGVEAAGPGSSGALAPDALTSGALAPAAPAPGASDSAVGFPYAQAR